MRGDQKPGVSFSTVWGVIRVLVSVTELLLRLCLGGVFAASAIPKLRRWEAFIITVKSYEILPASAEIICARLVPPLELVAGLLLVTGSVVRLASVLAGTLAAGFVVGVGVNLARGRRIECGCFGGRRRIGRTVLVQDLCIFAASCATAMLAGRWFGGDFWPPLNIGGSHAAISIAGPVAACIAAAICCAVSLRFSALRQVARERDPVTERRFG